MRFPRRLLAGCALALAAVSCAVSRATSEAPTQLRPVLQAAGAPLVVLLGQDPAELALATSRALFRSSPLVVVATADGLVEGARQAQRLRAPLLSLAGDADPAVAAEIRRLRARRVLVVGSSASPAPALPWTRDASTIHSAPPARPVELTVLVQEGSSAAAATARAAGATVVTVHGPDPRADPAAVRALATAPARVVVIGDALGQPDRLAARLDVARTGVQLPGGGQVLFPGRRLVALYGTPASPSLGVLGEQGLDEAVARARRVANPYEQLGAEPVVPAFEIIATVASGAPGLDGDYSNERSVADLRPWVEQATRQGLYVVLDLQPGRADFLSQARRYADLLALPGVGLALDPEWRLAPGQRPLQQIGGVDVDEVNQVIAWLADLTRSRKLPQKLLVLHQFRLSMLRGEARLDTSHDELALLVHMDGQGAPGVKDETWAMIKHAAPAGVFLGWKDFYDEDTPTLTPSQTLQHARGAVMISYQ